MQTIGLIGTITSDTIVYDEGRTFENVGGVLYQAAVFCGLGLSTRLLTNCGEDLRADVERLTGDWETLDRRGLGFVPGPGNRVFLRYSERLKEREEILRSVVPPLDPDPVIAALPGLAALMMVFNSGFDVSFDGWRRIVEAAPCPVWFDVHSLALAKNMGVHRAYAAVPDWPRWVRGVSFLQANRQEVACLAGHPARWPEESELPAFFAAASEAGVRAVFVTQGKDGVLAATPDGVTRVRAPAAETVVDTTGCGDVFAAATLVRIVAGESVVAAAASGVRLASQAVGVAGIRATYALARRSRFA
jgi:sugar/nucleoside kinase (ribokinase family)